MKHWQELKIAALLGSQKTAAVLHWPEQDVGVLGRALANQPSALLQQLALMSVYQRAGQLPVTLAPTGAAASDARPYASAAMSRHLAYLLGNEGQIYLPLWLELARQARVLAPRRYLPALLKLGDQQKTWRLQIADVAGARGGWLAQHNPDWRWLLAGQFDLSSPALTEFWQTAPQASRELLFERLRAADANAALGFLQQVWAEENAATRKVLLEKLRAGLSMADHDFLENCLDDRSKAVKDVAVDLLARLPESALVQRLQQVAARIVHIRKGMIVKHIEIIALDSLSPALERDGLEAKPKRVDNLGEKAQWLRDVFAGIGLDWLNRHCTMSAETILEKLLHSEWANAIMQGLMLAAKRQRHQDWLLALLHADSVKMPATDSELLPLLSPDRREHYLLAQFKADKKTGAALKTLVALCNAMPSWSWSADFTVRVMESYQSLNRSGAPLSYEFERQVFPQLLALLGRCGDAALGLQPNQYPPQVLANWQLRRDLQQAFSTHHEKN